MSENKVGRPTTYNEEIAAIILGRISEGESLRQITRSEGMPATSTIMLWLIKHPEFSEQYARAREAQSEVFADEMVTIADETPEMEPVKDKDGNIVDMKMHSAYVAWQKNRIDTRKWIASKLKPKKYGDKIDVTSDGKQVGLAINIDLGDKE